MDDYTKFENTWVKDKSDRVFRIGRTHVDIVDVRPITSLHPDWYDIEWLDSDLEILPGVPEPEINQIYCIKNRNRDWHTAFQRRGSQGLHYIVGSQVGLMWFESLEWMEKDYDVNSLTILYSPPLVLGTAGYVIETSDPYFDINVY